MSDYIKREDAIKAVKEGVQSPTSLWTIDENMFTDLKNRALLKAVERIYGSPSADVVEVVRCKDCKKNPKWEWVGCPMTGANTRKPNDYCSYGERRKDGTNA